METTDRSFFMEIATEIIANGCINDQYDWEEMKLELEYTFSEMGMAADRQAEGLQFVKKTWFSGE